MKNQFGKTLENYSIIKYLFFRDKYKVYGFNIKSKDDLDALNKYLKVPIK